MPLAIAFLISIRSALAKCFPAASTGIATDTISTPNAAARRFD
jgi:hypothetical protein